MDRWDAEAVAVESGCSAVSVLMAAKIQRLSGEHRKVVEELLALLVKEPQKAVS